MPIWRVDTVSESKPRVYSSSTTCLALTRPFVVCARSARATAVSL